MRLVSKRRPTVPMRWPYFTRALRVVQPSFNKRSATIARRLELARESGLRDGSVYTEAMHSPLLRPLSSR